VEVNICDLLHATLAEGQRPESIAHTQLICDKFVKSPYVDTAMIGVWVNETKGEIIRRGKKHIEESITDEQAILTAGVTQLAMYVYGGQHGVKGIVKALKENVKGWKSVEILRFSDKPVQVYFDLSPEMKHLLCIEHNEVAKLHKFMSLVDKLSIARETRMVDDETDRTMLLNKAKATGSLSLSADERVRYKELEDSKMTGVPTSTPRQKQLCAQLWPNIKNKWAMLPYLRISNASQEDWDYFILICKKFEEGTLGGMSVEVKVSKKGKSKAAKKLKETKASTWQAIFTGLEPEARTRFLGMIASGRIAWSDVTPQLTLLKNVLSFIRLATDLYNVTRPHDKALVWNDIKEMPYKGGMKFKDIFTASLILSRAAGYQAPKKSKSKKKGSAKVTLRTKVLSIVGQQTDGIQKMLETLMPPNILSVSEVKDHDFETWVHPEFGALKWQVLLGDPTKAEFPFPSARYTACTSSVQYGKYMHPGDDPENATSTEDITTILQHAVEKTTSQHMSILTWHSWEHLHRAIKATTDVCGEGMAENLIWYKLGPRRHMGTCVPNNTDTGVVGYWSATGKRKQEHLSGLGNNDSRSRVISAGPVNNKFKVTVNNKQEVLNPCEMNPEVEYIWLRDRCLPGEWVLCPCSGTGASIVSALFAGCNAVGYDRRKDQVVGSKAYIEHYLDTVTARSKEEWRASNNGKSYFLKPQHAKDVSHEVNTGKEEKSENQDETTAVPSSRHSDQVNLMCDLIGATSSEHVDIIGSVPSSSSSLSSSSSQNNSSVQRRSFSTTSSSLSSSLAVSSTSISTSLSSSSSSLSSVAVQSTSSSLSSSSLSSSSSSVPVPANTPVTPAPVTTPLSATSPATTSIPESFNNTSSRASEKNNDDVSLIPKSKKKRKKKG
jgi:hypothetical protein